MKHLLIAACLAVAGRASAADWKFATSVNYDTGKYGSGDRTSTVYVPVTLKRYYGYADVSLTAGWLSQSSTGIVTRVGGGPVKAGRRAAAQGAGGAESGFADLLLKGRYYLRDDGPRSFGLALGGTLKLPTASRKRGLGTGELDEGLGLELDKKISDWTLLADSYFTIIGDPPGVDYNNQLSFSLGFSRPAGPGLTLTALYETSSALLDGNPDQRDLNFTLERKARDGNVYGVSALLGLSSGSPAFGLGAGLSRRF
jgi:hypothetical protein